MAIYNAKKLTLVKGEDTYIIDPLQGNESVYIDFDVVILKNSWSAVPPYTYVWTDQRVTANCAVDVLFKDGVRDGLVGDFHFSKTGAGSVTFTTDEPPIGDIPIVIRIIESKADATFPIDADLIETDAITGETNVQGALEHLDTNKIEKNQGQANAGKALGINSQGIVEPVPFSMADMTGATASTAGTHGLVPAPAAGKQDSYLRGDGTWQLPPGSRPITVALDTVTNTSGSYTHTTNSSDVTASMKAIQIECSNPDAFNDSITITVSDGSITLACDDVAGTSDVSVVVMKQAGSGDPPVVTSTEFDILAGRIGTLSNLTTTEKANVVGAVNEVDDQITNVDAMLTANQLGQPTSQSALTDLLTPIISGMEVGKIAFVTFYTSGTSNWSSSEFIGATTYIGILMKISENATNGIFINYGAHCTSFGYLTGTMTYHKLY